MDTEMPEKRRHTVSRKGTSVGAESWLWRPRPLSTRKGGGQHVRAASFLPAMGRQTHSTTEAGPGAWHPAAQSVEQSKRKGPSRVGSHLLRRTCLRRGGGQDVARQTLGQREPSAHPRSPLPPGAQASHQSCHSCPRRSGPASAPLRQART